MNTTHNVEEVKPLTPEQERDIAVAMLADWVARVSEVGTGWDDWDEAYKDAAYRECPIRARLNAAIEDARRGYAR